MARFYTPEESLAIDRLIDLKTQLETANGDNFWTSTTEGMAQVSGAQYAFISKRMDHDENDPSIALPPLGEPHSCLLGLSIFYSGGEKESFNAKSAKYIAYESPCAHMKHGKVCLIPERLSEMMPNNPNGLPEEPEAYLAIPLSTATSSPKVFAHVGVMWTASGLAKRSLGFPFLEMMLHSLEDIIIAQFVEQGLVPEINSIPEPLPTVTVIPEPAKVYASFATSSSLKPYARSLSHELRTPMQGVVGMLDVMFAQVQEAGEGQVDPKIHELFTSLKDSIEIVQDSARRAVEAADNIVHAYDMNMSVPEAHVVDDDGDFDMDESLPLVEQDARVLPTPVDSESPLRGHKRARSSADTGSGHNAKSRRITSRDDSTIMGTPRKYGEDMIFQTAHEGTPLSHALLDRSVAPVPRATNVRDSLQVLVNDVINLGGRPISAIAEPIDGGETIEIRRKTASGEEKVQLVTWSVDSIVPETIVVDERDFAGLISRVLHNAFKFTESGKITVCVRLSSKGGYIVIRIEDTGIGIPAAFMPKLFKPFSKEDDGITRQSEGLGLGLMVAKGLARRLNGDLFAVRSETEGQNKGTEFQMRIPVTPGDSISRPSTPYESPSPASRLRSAEEEQTAGDTTKPRTPPYLSNVPRSQHSRSSSNTTRFGQYTNTLAQSGTATYSAENVTTLLEVPTTLFPPPGIITPPFSVAADHPNSTSMLRMGPWVPGNAHPDKGKLATRLPLSFLVVEDNRVLRKILVRMLQDLGYTHIIEAYDGADAVRQMERHRQRMRSGETTYNIDVVLMDLWMPTMNGYQATEKILGLYHGYEYKPPVVMAVTADTTDEATERVARAGMKGPLTKPYKTRDLERNLLELGI